MIPDDVKIFAIDDAIAHRLVLKPEHVLENVNQREVIREVINKVPVPKDYRRR